MRRLICFLLIFLTPQIAFAFEQSDEIVWLAMEGQTRIFERRYDDALRLFQEVEKEYPYSAVGPFGQMAVYEVQMLEAEDFHLEKEFLETAKRGEEIVDKIMQRYRPSDVDLFFSGGLIGLEGFFRARHAQWWGAYTRGNICRQIFNSILKRNPSFVDAQFGLGMYIYWRSVFTNEIKFLPFFSDRRKEGIAIVEKVAREGNLAREMAQVNLGIIYFEERRLADAERVFDDFTKRYPRNALLHMFYGKVLLADKKYDQAIEEFKKVAQINPRIIKANYFVGLALVQQGKKERMSEAKKYLVGYLGEAKERLWKSYALYWLGLMHEITGEKDVALKYYTQAFDLNRGLKGAKIKLRALGGGI